ncbi:macrophage activating glycoprotein [Mycena polygramma]|nr:macrophage activating glycoprotein [Mycena polygramma]
MIAAWPEPYCDDLPFAYRLFIQAVSSLQSDFRACGSPKENGRHFLKRIINSVDDFCLFAPPKANSKIPDTKTEEVAWCTKPRNNARVIPDDTITSVSFLKTDFYVQIMGTGDFTMFNIARDTETSHIAHRSVRSSPAEPHGAEGTGNPVGGNVTTNIVDGVDEPIAEWMLYMSTNQFCLRACTNANSTYSAALMHQLDVMGCEFVMPGTQLGRITRRYSSETCDADVAYPPGWYPTVVDGTTSFSTFAHRRHCDSRRPVFHASSSNCVTTSTIANNIALAPLGVTGSTASAQATSSNPSAGSSSSSVSASGSPTTSSSAAFRSTLVGVGSGGEYVGITLLSLVAGLAAISLLH